MNSIGRFMKKLSILFTRRRFKNELEEEMAFHREQAERDLIASGMTPEAARYAAMRQFGNATRLREQSHDVVGFSFEHLWQDLRYAIRQMMRAPGFAATVVVTLALGIGATTAIFTVVYSTLLRSLPYPGADRIVRVQDLRVQGRSAAGLVGPPRFFDLEARNKSFASVGFFYFENSTLIAGTRAPIAIRRAGANAGFWKVFRGRPLLGRTFDERDDNPKAPEVAVLSYKGWQTIFHGDPNIVGTQVTLEQQSTTIVGVMPADFNIPFGIDLWKPAQFDPGEFTWRGAGSGFLNVFALMRPGVSMTAAAEDLKRIGVQLQHEHPGTDGIWQFGGRPLRDDLFGELRPALIILWIASGFLLLMACINVGNLLLTRATAREHEVALRRALGASEARIRMQFLTESTLLALAGGAAGLGLAQGLIRMAASRLPGRLGVPGAVVMNGTVAWFAFGAAAAAAIAFGFLPALVGRCAAPNLSLKRADKNAGAAVGAWMRGAYVSVQVALSLVLLVGASLFAESLRNLIKSPLGFAPEHLLTFAINLPWSDDQRAITGFFDNAQRRIESLPGVTAVGEIDALPTVDWHMRSNFDADWLPRVPNRPALSAEDRHIAGNYLAAMGTQLLAGRAFTAQDQHPNSHSIMVNRELAQEYLPGGDVIGKHLIGGNKPLEIVGVVADVRGTAGPISKATGPEVYWPADADEGVVQRYFVVRSQAQPTELINAIREQVRQVDPLQAISSAATMDELLDKSVAQPRLNMALIAAFAVLALLMACVGIYGVVAWSVAHRVMEIGLRMALGATRTEVAWLFVRQAAMPTLAGIAAGTALALLLTQFVRSQLYGVTPANPWVYAISIPVLLLLVLFATLRPSLRAASVNPVDALRAE